MDFNVLSTAKGHLRMNDNDDIAHLICCEPESTEIGICMPVHSKRGDVGKSAAEATFLIYPSSSQAAAANSLIALSVLRVHRYVAILAFIY